MMSERPERPTEQQDANAPSQSDPPSLTSRAPQFTFLTELKRRNVGRVALLYLFTAWLVLQPVNVIFDMLGVPPWANRLVVILVAVGFPVALLLAWIYEVTPEGVRLTSQVEPQASITRQTGRRLDRVIIAVLAIAL